MIGFLIRIVDDQATAPPAGKPQARQIARKMQFWVLARDGPVLRVYTYGYERKNTFDHRFPEKLIKDAEQLMSSEEEDREKNRKIESSWTVKE